MAKLGDVADKIRSKNAGPFWLTIDIFCGDDGRYAQVSAALNEARIAAIYQAVPESVQRFDLPSLNVIKFSLPRPVVQGSRADRDMHASQWGWLLDGVDI